MYSFSSDNISALVQQHLFIEGKKRIGLCLKGLTLDQINRAPNAQITPISNQILHLNGNIRQWLGEGLLGLPYKRHREAEFSPQKLSAGELLSVWQELEIDLSEALPKLKTMPGSEAVQIQGFSETRMGALIHVLEHFSYHMGQIALLAKLYREADLSFYGSFDLNA